MLNLSTEMGAQSRCGLVCLFDLCTGLYSLIHLWRTIQQNISNVSFHNTCMLLYMALASHPLNVQDTLVCLVAACPWQTGVWKVVAFHGLKRDGSRSLKSTRSIQSLLAQRQHKPTPKKIFQGKSFVGWKHFTCDRFCVISISVWLDAVYKCTQWMKKKEKHPSQGWNHLDIQTQHRWPCHFVVLGDCKLSSCGTGRTDFHSLKRFKVPALACWQDGTWWVQEDLLCGMVPPNLSCIGKIFSSRTWNNRKSSLLYLMSNWCLKCWIPSSFTSTFTCYTFR